MYWYYLLEGPFTYLLIFDLADLEYNETYADKSSNEYNILYTALNEEVYYFKT